MRAGHLTRLKGVRLQQLSEEVVTPAEMVIMSIFNANISIFGGGNSKKRKRRATEIVDAAVESCFANKEKAAKERAALEG